MQVKRIAEWSILQYFRPSLTYHLSLSLSFCLFLNGRFTQVLLYLKITMILTTALNEVLEMAIKNEPESFAKITVPYHMAW